MAFCNLSGFKWTILQWKHENHLNFELRVFSQDNSTVWNNMPSLWANVQRLWVCWWWNTKVLPVPTWHASASVQNSPPLTVSRPLSLPFHTAVLWMVTAASFTHDSWLPGWSEVGQKGRDCAPAAVCFYQSGWQDGSSGQTKRREKRANFTRELPSAYTGWKRHKLLAKLI